MLDSRFFGSPFFFSFPLIDVPFIGDVDVGSGVDVLSSIVVEILLNITKVVGLVSWLVKLVAGEDLGESTGSILFSSTR